ncbi:hypothetical protein [Edaphobacter aggregans]|uniref:hypothetical protein n=1 Tax=Edaphobacter aggregans TaxID=570835 RepID=UPI0005576247|nr:hypothetical protein [Edaphobacter aggregans]
MKNLFRVCVVAVFAGQFVLAQTASHKSKTAAKPAAGAAAWTPDVQQYLGVQQGSFTMVGLNRLSKAQLDALVNAAKIGTAGDPRKHPLTCGPATPGQAGRVRVLVTVAGDDPQGQRADEIRQAVGALSGVDVVDAAANADRVLHVVIQEQTLGKRTIGYTASYVTATPCVDGAGGKNAEAELKGQLGTYTQPKGPALAQDLASMLDKDVQPLRGSR